MTLLSLVHGFGETTAVLAAGKPKAGAKSEPPAVAAKAAPVRSDSLPAAVEDMCEAIMAAVRTGRIGELRTAHDLNELKPEIGPEVVPDPIEYWKKLSADGDGREILSVLWTLLEGSFATAPLGRDIENNKLYIWPSLAEKPLASMTPLEEVELLRLVPPAEAAAMKARGHYTGWRLVIGADGTWHSFKKAQ